MILSRLLFYKSEDPTSYLPRRKPAGPMFQNPELNRMVDENYEQVLQTGEGKVLIPDRLHPITLDKISENGKKVANILIRNGFKAYLCGGAVRDLLWEEQVNDFDFVTNASNDDMLRLFPDMLFHSIPNGHEFGYLVYGEEIIDVAALLNLPASFYGLSKVPDFDPTQLYSDSILFGAMQRDLTINCLLYDMETGELVDPVGGLYDLREGIISVPMRDHVEAVLRNDPRIILRALRFKARFGFELTKELSDEILKLGPELVPRIAPDLVYLNLPAFFFGGFAADGVRALLDYGLMRYMFPSLEDIADSTDYREYAIKTCRAVDWIFDEGTRGLPLLAMAALLWPAVSHLQAQGEKNPAEKVLEAERKVIEINKDEAAFLYAALQIDHAKDKEDLHEQIMTVFGGDSFQDALGMLQIHYWMKPYEVWGNE